MPSRTTMNTRRSLPIAALILALLGGSLAGQQPAPAAPAATAPATRDRRPPTSRSSRQSPSAPKSTTSRSMRACSTRPARSLPASAPRTSRCSRTASRSRSPIFSVVNLPVTRAPRPLFASKPIEPDVATNLTGLDGRVYLIVLDDLHTSAQRTNQVKRGGAPVHRAIRWRQRSGGHRPHQRPQRRGAGVHDQPAPAARRGGSLHGTQGAVVHAQPHRRGAADPRQPPDRRSHRRHRRLGARLPGADGARHDEAAGRLPGRHQRPPQGARAVQRRRRLRHHRRDQQPRSAPW